MPDERRLIISSEPTLSPEEVARRSFSTVFRGWDPAEVRNYLARVSDELGVARERQRHTEHLLAQAEAKLAHPQVDEETLTSVLGEEAAKILGSAREAAGDVRTKAEENVERLLRQAHDDAARIRGEADGVLEARTAEAQEAADEIRQQAEAEAEATVEDARRRSREMLQEAKALRGRMLQDALRRRKVAHVQVTQLRAGRERLLQAYRLVRETLDQVTDELQRADAEARAAAEDAARRAAEETEIAVEEVEALFGADTEPEDDVVAPPPAATEVVASAVAVEAAIEAAVERPEETAPVALSADDLVVPDAAPEPAAVPEPAAPEPAAAPELVQAVASGELKVIEPPSEVEGVRIITDPPAEASAPSRDVDESPAAAAPPPVDDLFARIRAGRAEAVARAHDVLADEASTPVEAEAEPATNGSGEPSTSDAQPEDDDDHVFLERCDSLTGPIEAQLAKRLKRALQDEQNDVLDRLRVASHPADADEALASADDQQARYRDAALPLLQDAARAGGSFAGEPAAGVDVSEVAKDLAEALVTPLRQRLERAFGDGDPGEEVVARVSAAYREWKVQRIQRVAGDHVAAAFGRGVVAAMPEGTQLRWVGRDLDGPCPDCDDNALAGPTPLGEAYPTGQAHPPAHSGCRCLLVPAST